MFLALGGAMAASAAAQGQRETIDIPREHRGKPVTVTATLLLPPGTGKVPAMIVHHGSGGVSEAREFRYAREIVGMGVAALVIDSFKPRGVQSTVRDQAQVTVLEMTEDAVGAHRILAAHPRIEPSRIGIVGFSKGGTVALETLLERRWVKAPPGARFALHVPVYPACNSHYHRPKLAGGHVYMLLGGADTYAGIAPCTEYAAKLKAAGAKVEVKVYPGAKHGFDGERSYKVAEGENWSRCVFDEQPDRSWKERISGRTTFAGGKRDDAGHAAALAACRTLGVEGGPDAAARSAAMADLKAAVKRHLLDGM